MSTCKINTKTVENGIKNLVENTLNVSDMFNKEGDLFVVTSPQAYQFVIDLNKSFSQDVVKKVGDNSYKISIPYDLVKNYYVSTEDGKEIVRIHDMHTSIWFDKNSWNKGEMFAALNYPEVSEMTVGALKSFLLSVNPNFKVEEIDNLSVSGYTSLKDFLIQVKTLSKFTSLPEETAHVLITLLPDNHPLKIEMMENITSFPIYSMVYNKYKDTYLTSEGKPDFNKIKLEASAKLVAEFISAYSTGNNERLEVLAKPKQNFIKRWFNKLLKFLGLAMKDHTKAYADIAGLILTGKNELSLRDVEDLSFTESYWYDLSETQVYDNAFEIVEKIKPPKLLSIISDINREFSRSFRRILKEENFAALNEELKKEGNEVGRLNTLLDIKTLLNESDIDLESAMDSEEYFKGVKQFLEAVDKLSMLSDAILNVIKNQDKAKTFDEAIKNITELESYFSIYETFTNMISGKLAGELSRSDVGAEVVNMILDSKKNFDTVNTYILAKLEPNLLIFWQEILRGMNDGVSARLREELDVATKTGNKKIIDSVNEKIKKHIVSKDNIISMLSGTGKDIDPTSSLNHLLNAAILNGDPYVAGITKYIQSRLHQERQYALEDILKLNAKIDPIQKKLNEPAHVTGKKITFVDTVWDKAEGKEVEILTWLNPFTGIFTARDILKEGVREARDEYLSVDENDKELFDKKFAEYKAKKENYNKFLNDNFNRPYVKSYYHFREKFEADPYFVKAMEQYRNISKNIERVEDKLEMEPENIDDMEELAILRRERANLRNENDLYGDPKPEEELKLVRALNKYFEESGEYMEVDEIQSERVFNIARNKYKQDVNFAVQEIRRSNIAGIKNVEKKLREILRDRRINISHAFEAAGIYDMDFDFVEELLLDRWDSKNIIIQKNDEFYEEEKSVIAEIRELEQKGELTEVEILISKLYDERRALLYGSRDDIGQINPTALNDEEKLRLLTIEDDIEDLRTQKPPLTISPEEMETQDKNRWYQLTEIIADKSVNSRERIKAIKEKSRINKKYKDKGRAKAISDLWSYLGDLTETTATQYYWEKMNDFIPALSEYVKQWKELEMTDDEKEDLAVFEKDFTKYVETEDNENLDFYVYPSDDFKGFLDWLKDNRPRLWEWFVDNHSKRSVYDKANNGKRITLPFVRSKIYQHSTPVLDEHQKIVYSRRFQKRRVKNEYRTGYNPETGEVELKVGVHITNRESLNGFSEFLPLSPEQGAPSDSKYINAEYFRLKNSTDEKDKLRFEYLELLKEVHLKHQEMLPSRQRQWMQVPVMGLSNIESIKNVPSIVEKNWKIVKSAFDKSKEGDALAQEEGLDTMEDIDQITQSVIKERLPKIGMNQRVPVDQISTDVLKSVEQYIFRSYEFRARATAAPVVKAINRVMSDNNFKGATSNKERFKIFEKIYSQMILEEVPESNLNNKKMRRVAKIITANTSLRMLADPIGGIINYGSAMVNNIIEASSGKYISLQELGKGKILAAEMNISLLSDFNKKTGLSYNTLLFQYFDLLQGDFQEDLLDRSSSLDKKSSWKQLLMIPRKAGELMAQLSIGLGMMERVKVKNQIDGKMYPLHQIYKKEGDLLTLKEGFWELDEKGEKTYPWNPRDGRKFFDFRRLVERVNLGLHGNYARMNQTEASRHALGKLGENMKRWFMPAFQRRFGRETPDILFEDLDEGYYQTTWSAAKNYFSALYHLDFAGVRGWTTFYFNTDRNRQNLQRMGAEVTQSLLLFLTFAVLLGYSGDDKNKELEKNSWLHNTAILIALRVYSETNAYIPIPQVGPFFGGFQEMKRNVLAPFSLPADAISNFAAIAQLGLYQVAYWLGADSLKKDLYYDRDAGFWYSEEGDSKFMRYLYKTFGLTGLSGFSPSEGFSGQETAAYIKNFDNLQKRLK